MLMVTACGETDVAAALDRICTDEAAAFATVSESTPEGPAEVADQIESAIAVREEALAEVRELEPPGGELREPFADYLANREESLAVMRTAASAAAADDRETLGVALERLAQLTSDRELIAAQLGADGCRAPGGD